MQGTFSPVSNSFCIANCGSVQRQFMHKTNPTPTYKHNKPTPEQTWPICHNGRLQHRCLRPNKHHTEIDHAHINLITGTSNQSHFSCQTTTYWSSTSKTKSSLAIRPLVMVLSAKPCIYGHVTGTFVINTTSCQAMIPYLCLHNEVILTNLHCCETKHSQKTCLTAEGEKSHDCRQGEMHRRKLHFVTSYWKYFAKLGIIAWR